MKRTHSTVNRTNKHLLNHSLVLLYDARTKSDGFRKPECDDFLGGLSIHITPDRTIYCFRDGSVQTFVHQLFFRNEVSKRVRAKPCRAVMYRVFFVFGNFCFRLFHKLWRKGSHKMDQSLLCIVGCRAVSFVCWIVWLLPWRSVGCLDWSAIMNASMPLSPLAYGVLAPW